MLHEKLARLRQSAGLTQEQLAEKMYVSRELVSKWEHGSRRPDVKALRRLAGFYGVEFEYLLEDENELILELQSCAPPGADLPPEKLTEALNSFLNTLSARDRGVFVRRYYYLESPADIAETYDIKENYTRTLLARTRKKLTKYLKEAVR